MCNPYEGENAIGDNKHYQMSDAVNACSRGLTEFLIEAELSNCREKFLR